MIAALKTEYRKLVTTRLWWVLLLTMAAYMAFLAVVLAFPLVLGESTGPDGAPVAPLEPKTIAMILYTIAPGFGYVFPVIAGALSVTGEFRHMTITPTLLSEPRRGVVLGAKLLAGLPVGLLFGLAGTGATVLAGGATLAIVGEPTFLSDPEVLRALGRSVLALTLWTMVGVAFGTMVTNQVLAIVILLAFTQFVEFILRFGLAAFDATADVAKWLPGAAGEAVAGQSFFASSGLAGTLGFVPGLLVMLGYAAVFAVVGRFTSFRRDTT